MSKRAAPSRRSRQKGALKRSGTRSKNTSSTSGHWTDQLPVIILVVTAIIILQSRLQWLPIPLERDEGGFAYMGYWLLHGKSLYTDFVDNKLPGLYILYGIVTSVFGYHSIGVHIGLLLSNLVAAICFFLLLRPLFSHFVACIATAFFLTLTSGMHVMGFAAHATQLLLPFVLGGFLLFWQGIEKSKGINFFMAGLLIGVAFLIKQQSAVFGLLLAVLWWPLRSGQGNKQAKRQIREWILLGAGGLLPVAVTAIYFLMTGRLDELYFWSYIQPQKLAGLYEGTRRELFSYAFSQVITYVEGIWILAATGAILIWFTQYKKWQKHFGFFVAMLGLSSIVIGVAFYWHYFVLALPGVAILAALTLEWLSGKIRKSGDIVVAALAFLLIATTFVRHAGYYFNPDFNKIHQSVYYQSMFPEIARIGKELEKRVPANAKIGIVGSEPELLVYTNREGCTDHLYMYPLTSDPDSSPQLQEEFMRELQECSPEYLVFSTIGSSWAPGFEKTAFFNSVTDWIGNHYGVLGIAAYQEGEPGVIVWDEEVNTFDLQTTFRIYVMKKNS